jgi:glutamine---fructose-6-phosphate transaminase (isomerizing)
MPVIVIAPYDMTMFSRRPSRTCRKSPRAAASSSTDAKGASATEGQSLAILTLPTMAAEVTPIVYAVPVQLLAYHTAVVMGTDVDQPRNLAKSVTVE